MTWLPMTNCKSRLTHQSVYVLDWFHKRLPSSFHFWMNFYMSACFANDHQSMASHGVAYMISVALCDLCLQTVWMPPEQMNQARWP
uniref:Uncharacterized protein n=1 Tax=Populus trichocarpa TaxID=3694 RepID=A0A2K2AKJ4_POPTR